MDSQKKWSFKEAFHSLPFNEMQDVRREIEEAVGIKNSVVWYNRLNGTVEPKASEYIAITRIFAKRGIKAFNNDLIN